MKVVRGIWKLLMGIKNMLVLLFMLIFFGLLFAALSFSPNPRIASSGALLIDLDGALVEQPSEPSPTDALTGANPATREYRLRNVTRAIQAAATDPAIKAVVLDLAAFPGGGQAAIGEVGRALDTVRAKGKPVLVYALGYGDDGYQLAAHASEIWLDPYGAVMVSGPGRQQLYYKGLMDKLGIQARVYRVGTFKSAVEPYILTGQSPAAREANQALADSLWAAWRADVARARPRAQIAAYVAAPAQVIAAQHGDVAKAALTAGLVDRLGDRLTFDRRVADIAGADPSKEPGGYRAVPLDAWLAGHPAPKPGAAIGVVTIAGTIVDGEAGPGTAGGDTIAGLILGELARNRIKALVVRVDSPGGSVTASERIRAAIMEAKRKGLPVVVSMGSVAASGGYWVSTPGDRIFAEPSTITGSIGVFGILPTFQGTLAKLGLSTDGVKTTPLSGQPDLYRGPSPEFDQLLQAGIEQIYGRFTGLVAQGRHMTPQRVDQIGQGRVWAGETARGLGLVDAFGGLDAAIAEAARLAKLDPARVHALDIEQQPSWIKQLLANAMRGDKHGSDSQDAWTRLARRPEQDLIRGLIGLRAMADGPAIQVQCLECPMPFAASPSRREREGTLAWLAARLLR